MTSKRLRPACTLSLARSREEMGATRRARARASSALGGGIQLGAEDVAGARGVDRAAYQMTASTRVRRGPEPEATVRAATGSRGRLVDVAHGGARLRAVVVELGRGTGQRSCRASGATAEQQRACRDQETPPVPVRHAGELSSPSLRGRAVPFR